MAILHRKEEKIQAVLGRLNKNYTTEQFVEMFIKLYSKEWGKIKSAYVKQSQDKEPGTVVNMPKPALYLEQLLAKYLSENSSVEKTTEVVVEEKAVKAPAEKKETIKKASATKEITEKTVKATAVKKVATKKESATAEIKEKAIKAPAVKKASVKKESATAEVKEKATKKKTVTKD